MRRSSLTLRLVASSPPKTDTLECEHVLLSPHLTPPIAHATIDEYTQHIYRSGSQVSLAERRGPIDAADPWNLTWVTPA